MNINTSRPNEDPICIQSVYYVSSAEISEPSSFNRIAIRPTIDHKRISWEDTERGSFFIFETINLNRDDIQEYQDKKIPPKRIKFKTNKGKEIELELLTSEVFDRSIKNNVAGSLSFQSNEELQNYYLNQQFSSY